MGSGFSPAITEDQARLSGSCLSTALPKPNDHRSINIVKTQSQARRGGSVPHLSKTLEAETNDSNHKTVHDAWAMRQDSSSASGHKALAIPAEHLDFHYFATLGLGYLRSPFFTVSPQPQDSL